MSEANVGLDRLVICPTCNGEGGIDSGGSTPWGEPIYLPCPSCGGKTLCKRCQFSKTHKKIEGCTYINGVLIDKPPCSCIFFKEKK